jgi:hypothetical protein
MRALGTTIEANPFPEPPWFIIIGILELLTCSHNHPRKSA